MRVFIGLTEVSGYYARLHRGLVELGVQAEFFPLQDHRFGYGTPSTQFAPRLARWCVRKRVGALAKGWATRMFWLGMVTASRAAFFAWALIRFDVFLMGGGSSFFRFRELALMRFLGKRVVYTFHGTDSRPAWMDGFCEGTSRISGQDMPDRFPTETDLTIYRRVSAERLNAVRRIEQYANVVINAPPQAQFLTRPYVIGLAVGIPVDDVVVEQELAQSENASVVRVLHSPSFHVGKGTSEIREAIRQLKQSGFAIDYAEISNRPHIEVRRAIAACDFVVDQVYSDSPMAGFAAEAALAGKPAVVCGYYCANHHADLAPHMRPPSLYCHPNQLAESIRSMVTNADRRRQLGAAAQEFVRTRWAPKAVARRYLALASGEEIPPDWIYDPARNRYFLGMGIDEHSLRVLLRHYLDKYGDDALGINAAPALKRLVLEFAARSESCIYERSDATR